MYGLLQNQVGFDLKIDGGDRKESRYNSVVTQHWVTDIIWGEKRTQNFPAGKGGETGRELRKMENMRENKDVKKIK